MRKPKKVRGSRLEEEENKLCHFSFPKTSPLAPSWCTEGVWSGGIRSEWARDEFFSFPFPCFLSFVCFALGLGTERVLKEKVHLANTLSTLDRNNTNNTIKLRGDASNS